MIAERTAIYTITNNNINIKLLPISEDIYINIYKKNNHRIYSRYLSKFLL